MMCMVYSVSRFQAFWGFLGVYFWVLFLGSFFISNHALFVLYSIHSMTPGINHGINIFNIWAKNSKFFFGGGEGWKRLHVVTI